jgi:Ser/Thr protein kinase RdoA (MazF antagonist)
MPAASPSDPLSRAALQTWPDVIAAAGMRREGWTLSRLSKRDDAQIARIIYLAQHPIHPDLTYRYQMRPDDHGGFLRHYEFQQETYDRFPHSDQLSLPRPIYVDDARHCSLITYAPGRPLSDHMREADLDRPRQQQLLGYAARWLDAYHRSRPLEPRNFNPGHTVKYYKGLRDQIRNGDTQVAQPELFLKGIRKIIRIAPDFAGLPTVSAVQHGDYHMRNLILDGTRTCGIDISKADHAPVGYDIAKILLDYTALMNRAGDLAQGTVVPEDALEVFFENYTLVGPDDPSVRFLLYPRILATLIHVPADESKRSFAKERTLQRLTPIARTAFKRSL